MYSLSKTISITYLIYIMIILMNYNYFNDKLPKNPWIPHFPKLDLKYGYWLILVECDRVMYVVIVPIEWMWVDYDVIA